MRAIVDPDTCTGCEACVNLSPKVYEMNGDVAQAKVDPVPSDLEADARDGAEACPVEAITIEE